MTDPCLVLAASRCLLGRCPALRMPVIVVQIMIWNAPAAVVAATIAIAGGQPAGVTADTPRSL